MWYRYFYIVLVLFSTRSFVRCYDSEDVSLEHEGLPSNYDVEILEGRSLRLRNDGPLCNPSWLHNGRPVSRTRCKVGYGELVCPAITRKDAGRYDLWGGDGTAQGKNRLKLSAFVRVTQNTERIVLEPELRAPQEYEPIAVPPRFRERWWDECFCSGVTGRCTMAPNLYRARITYNLSNAERDQQVLNSFDGMPAANYVKIPGTVFGNMITAYGGYLRFPLTEECYSDRSKPCMILNHKRLANRAIAFYVPRQHDQLQVQVHMTEASWVVLGTAEQKNQNEPENILDRRELSKFSFMSMLSNIEGLYIRGSYRTRGDENLLTVDVASRYDGGLGMVTTVEQCDCHEGYAGFSCERCDRNYLRTYETVNENGVCISYSDLWQASKTKHGVNRLDHVVSG